MSKRCGLFTYHITKTNETSSVTSESYGICFTPQEKHRYKKHSEGNFLINDAGDLSTWKLDNFSWKSLPIEL